MKVEFVYLLSRCFHLTNIFRYLLLCHQTKNLTLRNAMHSGTLLRPVSGFKKEVIPCTNGTLKCYLIYQCMNTRNLLCHLKNFVSRIIPLPIMILGISKAMWTWCPCALMIMIRQGIYSPISIVDNNPCFCFIGKSCFCAKLSDAALRNQSG